MKQSANNGLASTPLRLMATEVSAGFSAACLLTLAVISPPLRLTEKVSICCFSMAIPLLVWARIVIEDEENLAVLQLCAWLRFWGYLLTIAGFGLLLGAVFWPSLVVFGITVAVTFIAWLRSLHSKSTADGQPAGDGPAIAEPASPINP